MKRFFYKIAAIFLTIVVLTSTMSFTMLKMYCKGNLVQTAVFSKIIPCDTQNGNNCNLTSESCCDFEKVVFDGLDELRFTSNDLEVSYKNVFIPIKFEAYASNFAIQNKKLNSYIKYHPPNLVADIQVIHQVFII
jgi:hypothetical protein